jgi:hypothetical protein
MNQIPLPTSAGADNLRGDQTPVGSPECGLSPDRDCQVIFIGVPGSGAGRWVLIDTGVLLQRGRYGRQRDRDLDKPDDPRRSF